MWSTVGIRVRPFPVFTLHKSIGWYSQKACHTISSVCHLYADDTQLHLSFTTYCPNYASNAKETVELCVKDIGHWMLCNKQLNKLILTQNKTELLVVSSRHRPRPHLNHIQIGDDVICPCEHARNLGLGFESISSLVSTLNWPARSLFSAFVVLPRLGDIYPMILLSTGGSVGWAPGSHAGGREFNSGRTNTQGL